MSPLRAAEGGTRAAPVGTVERAVCHGQGGSRARGELSVNLGGPPAGRLCGGAHRAWGGPSPEKFGSQAR